MILDEIKTCSVKNRLISYLINSYPYVFVSYSSFIFVHCFNEGQRKDKFMQYILAGDLYNFPRITVTLVNAGSFDAFTQILLITNASVHRLLY